MIFLGDAISRATESDIVCSQAGIDCRERRYEEVQFEVVEGFSAQSEPSLIVHTDRVSSNRARFQPQRRYLVIARKHDNQKWFTNSCRSWLIDPMRDDYEDRMSDLDYLRSIQHQLSNPWLARIDSKIEYVNHFLEHQIAQSNAQHHGIPFDIEVRSILWHDLDQDGEDDLIAHYTIGQLVDPGKVGPWIRQERHGLTVFLNRDETLDDRSPTWLNWCSETEHGSGLLGEGDQIIVLGCQDEQGISHGMSSYHQLRMRLREDGNLWPVSQWQLPIKHKLDD